MTPILSVELRGVLPSSFLLVVQPYVLLGAVLSSIVMFLLRRRTKEWTGSVAFSLRLGWYSSRLCLHKENSLLKDGKHLVRNSVAGRSNSNSLTSSRYNRSSDRQRHLHCCFHMVATLS